MADAARNRSLIAAAWRRSYDPTRPARNQAETRAALDAKLLEARAAEHAAPKPPPARRTR